MRTFKVVLMTALLLILCIGSLFAGGFALSGIGSKAISMGGAFRGMADDGTAMYWNPAGLGFIDKSFITLAGAGIMPTAEFQNNQMLPGFTDEVITAEKKLWLFPNLYAVKGGECKFKYGLGVYVPYGLGATWDAFNLPDSMMVAPNVFMPVTWADGFPEEEMMSSIGIVDVHPTFAYKFTDRFSFGAGLSVYYGMIEIAKLQPNPDYGYYIPTTLEMEGSGLGYGANFGMMWKVSDYAKLGLTGKLPAKINMEGDADMRIWYNNVIGMGTAIVREFNPDIEAELNLPGDIGWGLSLKATENWTINTDFSYTFWNNLDKVVIAFDPPIDLTPIPVILEESELVTKWKDTFRISLGTQYQLNNLALRGGFFYDESPVPDGTLTPTLPDTADKYSGNFGIGWQLGKWLLDVNYEHIFFAEREIETQTAENMAGIYNNDVNAFNMGLTYNF